jgi:hypothetical protein
MNIANLKAGSFIEVTEVQINLINAKLLQDYEKLRDAAPDLLDALLTALPFVEDALDDDSYKKASVLAAIRKITLAIGKATQ